MEQQLKVNIYLNKVVSIAICLLIYCKISYAF